MAIRSLGVGLLATLLSCGGKGLSDGQKQQVIDQVRSTLANYARDVSDKGLSAELAYLDSSEAFYWVPPGYRGPIRYDSVAAILARMQDQGISVKNTYADVVVTPLCLTHAVYSSRVHSRSVDGDGRVSSVNLLETGVMINRTGKWKLMSGQTAILQ